jgi:hypothetical protein
MYPILFIYNLCHISFFYFTSLFSILDFFVLMVVRYLQIISIHEYIFYSILEFVSFIYYYNIEFKNSQVFFDVLVKMNLIRK